MSKLSQRIKELRHGRYTQQELAKLIGVSKSSVNMYERGEREPSIETLEAIADVFNVDMDYLIGKSNTPNSYAEGIFPDNVVPMPIMRKIPLVGTIACGTPILAQENIEDDIDIPERIHADFALRCKGDSMIGADIRDGDIVYIRQQDAVYNGQIAAVLIDDEATLKRFYYDESTQLVTLVSENPSIPPKTFSGELLDHIRILGLAVGLTRRI